MSNPMSTNHTDTRASRVRRLLVPAAIAVAVVQTAFNALVIQGETPGPETDGRYVSSAVIPAIAALLVFGIVLAWALRQEAFGGVALTLSVLGVVLVPGYWLGLTLVVGVAGALLGWAGLRIPKGNGASRAAFVLGLLVIVANLATYTVVLLKAPPFS